MHPGAYDSAATPVNTIQPLRDYQARALESVRQAWDGCQAVCLVSPTGSGKTRMGEEFVRREPGRTLFVVHRRELLKQTRDRFAKHFYTSCVAEGFEYDPNANVFVATIQSLLARQMWPPATLLILDEAHHYAANSWAEVLSRYSSARVLGLTATPERADGSPLGDIFQELVVAAQYSELIAQGHLVQCRVFAPDDRVDGLAQDPVLAYTRFAESSRAFLFSSRVEHALKLAASFQDAGIPSATITAKTPGRDRDDHLAAFGAGTTRILSNVAVLTEGVDVPAARTCILARSCDHESLYLQIVGRVLRPHASKPDAILIDLTGATLKHGLPTEDRIYSLTGQAITRTSAEPIRQCKGCGHVYPLYLAVCPHCGYAPEPTKPKLRIYDRELALVFAGTNTPDAAKDREWTRLVQLTERRGWGIGWAAQEYVKLFGHPPPLPPEAQRSIYSAFRSHGTQRGFKPGFAAARFKQIFGKWPPRSWSMQ